MKPTVDVRKWPMVRLTYDGDYTDAELLSFLEELRSHFNKGPFVILVDARRGTRPSATQRKMMVESDQHRTTNLRALATVTESALVRGALTALEWMSKPAYPSRVFANDEDAVRWLMPHLEDGASPRASR